MYIVTVLTDPDLNPFSTTIFSCPVVLSPINVKWTGDVVPSSLSSPVWKLTSYPWYPETSISSIQLFGDFSLQGDNTLKHWKLNLLAEWTIVICLHLYDCWPFK